MIFYCKRIYQTELPRLNKGMFFVLLTLLVGCTRYSNELQDAPPSAGHIQPVPELQEQIPPLVQALPELPEPQSPMEFETYTVSIINEVPIKEVLFALARDAKINIDVDPKITGNVTINAINQTLPNLLKRLSRQIAFNARFEGDTLIITADRPHFRTYTINYINISRTTDSTNTVATSLASDSAVGGGESGGGGDQDGGAFSGSNSTLDVISSSSYQLWDSLTRNIIAIITEDELGEASQAESSLLSEGRVIPAPEVGVISVKATSRQHESVQRFLDQALANVRRQVLIQATIVEVRLTEDYQAGINWSLLNEAARKAGIEIILNTLPSQPVNTVGSLVLRSQNSNASLTSTIRLLHEFGDVKVISSPQMMALNNQTAILKRLENRVFFTADTNVTTSTAGDNTSSSINIHSLPIGIVMAITPHITASGEITLYVRPTISRQIGMKSVPLPNNINVSSNLPTNQANFIPETITQEMESLIRLNSGEIAILGGLMEDSQTGDINTVPGLGRLKILRNLFKSTTKQFQKTEVVIFLRPIVIDRPSLDHDLREYRQFLSVNPPS